MKELVLPWPSVGGHVSRDDKGWLLPNPDSGLSDYEEARRLFIIDLESGVITRRITIGQRAKAGSIVGYQNNGRNWLRFRGRKVPATRVIWLYAMGSWPTGQIDHINGDTLCDRISNLRDVDRSTNLENLRGPRSDNILGVQGVRFRRGKYEARIMLKGKAIHIGSFGTAGEAHQAYLDMKRKIHAGCTI